jgi:ABC-2 type transport system permease protein
MFTIASRELRSLFHSPLAWSVLSVVQLILAILFIIRLSLVLQPDVQSQLSMTPGAPSLTDIVVGHIFVWTGIILLLVMPLLTMRLISEERRNKTLVLLMSSPISMTSIVLGKYLGLMSFFILMLAMISLMPLSLVLGGQIDFGQFSIALFGVLLLIGALCAIGLYISALSEHPTVAAISTFGVFLLLWIIDWAGDSGQYSELFAYLSITRHYQTLLEGLLNTTDIIYYLLIIVLFNILTIHRLDAERLQ